MSGAVTSLGHRIGVGVAWPALLLLLPAVSHSADLRSFVENLYGGNGVQLSPTRSGLDFESASFGGLEALNSEIASSLNFVSSGGGGSSFTFDLELGTLIETPEGFGSLVAERADTIGARRLSLGFSYTRIDFKRFNGESLSDVSLAFSSIDLNRDGKLGPLTNSPNDPLLLELDEVRLDLNVEIEQDIFALLGKYGITEFWDTELIIPIIRIRAHASAEARVACNETNTTLCESFHFFDPAAGGDGPSSSLGGTEAGIGDVVLRSKYHFLRDSDLWPDLALRGQIKLPTGAEEDLLGTGETGFQLMLIASKTWWRFTPHLNLAYELSTGPSDLDNLRYAVGFEARAHQRLTLALDVIGRWAPRANRAADHIADIAVGGRWKAWRSLLLNAGLQFPLNGNTGLRPDVIWTLGLEYPFGGG